MGLVRTAKLAVMRRLGRALGLPGLEARLGQIEMRGPIADSRLDQCEQAVPAAMRAQRIATDLEKRADLHFQQLFDIVDRETRRLTAQAASVDTRFAAVAAQLALAAERAEATAAALRRTDEEIWTLSSHVSDAETAFAARADTLTAQIAAFDSAIAARLDDRSAALESNFDGRLSELGAALSGQVADRAQEVAEVGRRVTDLVGRLDESLREQAAIAAHLAQSEARLMVGEDAVGRMSARIDQADARLQDNDALLGRIEVAVGRLREESEGCRAMVGTIRQWIDAVDGAGEGEDRKQALLRLRAHVSDLEARMNLFHGERINLIRHFLFGAVEDRVRSFVPFSSLES